MTTPSHFALPFLKKEQIANDTYSFYFDRTAYLFDFKPGQYVRMILDLKTEDPRGRFRFFSISSSPAQKDMLMIATKITADPSPFKQQMLSFQEGEEVRFFGPLGKFVLPDESDRSFILLAGGIGLTPFHSMLQYASDKDLSFPITLITSFSTVEEAAFYQELKAIEENGKRDVVYTITHPEEGSDWQGETGRISQQMLEKYILFPKDCIFYICGPQKMVEAMEDMVRDNGIPDEQIRKESFTGY